MGREVRRVPLDFNWEIGKVWDGFLLPEALREDSCHDCENGTTTAHAWLHTFMHRLGMVAEDLRDQSQGRPLHPWLVHDTYPPTKGFRSTPVRPSRDIIDLVAGLSKETPERVEGQLFGPDPYRMVRTVIEAAGLDPDAWGMCLICEGHGSVEAYEGQRAEAEKWEPTPPPEGDGYQLWSTTTEGHPVSPVYTTPEGLAEWMTSEAEGWSRAESFSAAMRFIDAGWAPSMVVSEAGVQDGVEFMGNRPTGAKEET